MAKCLNDDVGIDCTFIGRVLREQMITGFQVSNGSLLNFVKLIISNSNENIGKELWFSEELSTYLKRLLDILSESNNQDQYINTLAADTEMRQISKEIVGLRKKERHSSTTKGTLPKASCCENKCCVVCKINDFGSRFVFSVNIQFDSAYPSTLIITERKETFTSMNLQGKYLVHLGVVKQYAESFNLLFHRANLSCCEFDFIINRIWVPLVCNEMEDMKYEILMIDVNSIFMNLDEIYDKLNIIGRLSSKSVMMENLYACFSLDQVILCKADVIHPRQFRKLYFFLALKAMNKLLETETRFQTELVPNARYQQINGHKHHIADTVLLFKFGVYNNPHEYFLKMFGLSIKWNLEQLMILKTTSQSNYFDLVISVFHLTMFGNSVVQYSTFSTKAMISKVHTLDKKETEIKTNRYIGYMLYYMGVLNTLRTFYIMLALIFCQCFVILLKAEKRKRPLSVSAVMSVISCIILSQKEINARIMETRSLDLEYCRAVLKSFVYDNIEKHYSKKVLKGIINHIPPGQNITLSVYPATNPPCADMSNELQRIGTFHSFPQDNCPSLIRLAAAGFYYIGKDREVQCFSCDARHSDWSYNSVPAEVHQRISPNCRYLNEHSEVCQATPIRNGNKELSTQENTNLRMETVIATDSGSNEADQLMLPSSSHSALLTRHSDSGFGSGGSGTGHSSYQFGRRSGRNPNLVTSSDSGYGSNLSIGQFTSSNSDIHTDNRGAPLQTIAETHQSCGHSSLSSISITSAIPPKYPEYQNIERRRATYKNWPSHLNFLHPLDLSECGFFYSNFGDCVRCYQCGIGLRNWESDDNPWVEHARWSRKCPYLIQKKGQEFIDSVLTALGIQTDAEIEESARAPPVPLILPQNQVSKDSGFQTKEDGDPLTHEAAKYVIKEKIFGVHLELIKSGMDELLKHNDWKVITKEMLVSNLLEKHDGVEFMDTDKRTVGTAHKTDSTTANSVMQNCVDQTSNEVTGRPNKAESQLVIDPEKALKENEELKDMYTCKICLDEKVGITFVPCGHLVTCKTCSPKLRRCPLCRQFIRGTIKTTI